jgi:hypothetical protein
MAVARHTASSMIRGGVCRACVAVVPGQPGSRVKLGGFRGPVTLVGFERDRCDVVGRGKIERCRRLAEVGEAGGGIEHQGPAGSAADREAVRHIAWEEDERPSLDDRVTSMLAVTALRNAVALRGGPAATVVHSDRGSQGGLNRSSQHLS